MLGDAGAYVLSFFVGYLIIICHSSNPDISPYFFITLLWYPCYENLFSIIRKLKNKFSPLSPDNNHLHQLIYQKFNKIISDKVIANNASSILINIANFIILLLAARYPYESIYQLKIISTSIFLYTSIFFIRWINFKSRSVAVIINSELFTFNKILESIGIVLLFSITP